VWGTVGRSVGRLGDAVRCVVCWIGKKELAAMGMERMVERGGRRGEEEEMEMEMESKGLLATKGTADVMRAV
jgi:hypothetical protein